MQGRVLYSKNHNSLVPYQEPEVPTPVYKETNLAVNIDTSYKGAL